MTMEPCQVVYNIPKTSLNDDINSTINSGILKISDITSRIQL